MNKKYYILIANNNTKRGVNHELGTNYSIYHMLYPDSRLHPGLEQKELICEGPV